MMDSEKLLVINSFCNVIQFLSNKNSVDLSTALKTSERFIETYLELLGGYFIKEEDLEKSLFTLQESASDCELDLINLEKIHFVSICKHHLLPFYGEVSISYIPNKYIIGLGSFAKIIDIFSKKMQLQEKLTIEIGNMINKILQPKFLSIKIEATHLCLSIRGAKKFNSVFKTEKIYNL